MHKKKYEEEEKWKRKFFNPCQHLTFNHFAIKTQLINKICEKESKFGNNQKT